MEFEPQPIHGESISSHSMVIFGIWQNSHFDSLTCGIKAIMVGRGCHMEAPETPTLTYSQDGMSKTMMQLGIL